MDTLDKIIAFEQGDMDEDQVVSFFQELVDRGLAWQLQGAYGRMAAQLIERGYVHPATLQ
jgi:hypothetical protein